MGKYVVYVIACKTPHHFYVGYSSNFDKRIKTHKLKGGSVFTKVHGFNKVIFKKEIDSVEDAKKLENKLTFELIGKYGSDNVAGAGHTTVNKKIK